MTPSLAPRNPTLCLLGLLALLATAPARAERLDCIAIESLPVVIDAPGHYCLVDDLAASLASGTAIDAVVGDVLLDCNHHELRNTFAGGSQTGIRMAAASGRSVVRHCRVVAFDTGIAVTGGAAGRIERNTVLGAYTGITVDGSGHAIVDNRIGAISTACRSNPPATGIHANGNAGYINGVEIRGNHVSGFDPPTGSHLWGCAARGIDLYRVRNSVVADNTILGLGYHAAPGGIDHQYGIRAHRSSLVKFERNLVLSPPGSPPQHHGLVGYDDDGSPTNSVCIGNTVGHYAENIAGCEQVDNVTY